MRSFHFFVAALCTLPLVACVSGDGPPKREPLKLAVSIKASSGVNPDDKKRPAPILVRVYELKSADVFDDADFYSLQDKDKSVLAEDWISRDQFLLRPGETKTINRNANDASTVLGVIAAYRDLPNSVWRANWPLPVRPVAAWYRRAPRLPLTIDIDADAVRISEAQPKTK